ncbi:MAG: hypothetical protein M1378_11910 [Bacteroidetes bacterium]|nr:hypothetical protein [Bacteroidota bacterium]
MSYVEEKVFEPPYKITNIHDEDGCEIFVGKHSRRYCNRKPATLKVVTVGGVKIHYKVCAKHQQQLERYEKVANLVLEPTIELDGEATSEASA